MSVRFKFLRDVWGLIKPYWTSEERFTAWLLLGAVIALTLAMVYMSVQFNYWNNDFYNALQEKDKASFWKLMGRFTMLATIYIAMAVYAFYLNQMLQIRWRRWLTDSYLNQWLSDRAYYRLQLSGNPADNPDQRIAEDMHLFVDQSLDLALGFLNAVVTLGSFVGISVGPVRTTRDSLQRQPDRHTRLYALGGTVLCHRRHLAHPQDRQETDRTEFLPAALRGGFPLRTGAFSREYRRCCALQWRAGRNAQLPRAVWQHPGQLVADHEAPENPQYLHHRLQPGRHHFSRSSSRATAILPGPSSWAG